MDKRDTGVQASLSISKLTVRQERKDRWGGGERAWAEQVWCTNAAKAIGACQQGVGGAELFLLFGACDGKCFDCKESCLLLISS